MAVKACVRLGGMALGSPLSQPNQRMTSSELTEDRGISDAEAALHRP